MRRLHRRRCIVITVAQQHPGVHAGRGAAEGPGPEDGAREKLYYKAYGNQAIYASAYINRGEAVETAKALYRQAKQEQSQYGLYTANYVLGTIYTGLSMLDEAKSHYRDALDILKGLSRGEPFAPLSGHDQDRAG